MSECKSCGVGRIVRKVWCVECDPGPARDDEFAPVVAALQNELRDSKARAERLRESLTAGWRCEDDA